MKLVDLASPTFRVETSAEKMQRRQEEERARLKAEAEQRRRQAEAAALEREKAKYLEWAKDHAWDAIRQNLKDPYSAIMRNIELGDSTGSTDFLFYITVQARNSFGAYVVSQ